MGPLLVLGHTGWTQLHKSCESHFTIHQARNKVFSEMTVLKKYANKVKLNICSNKNIPMLNQLLIKKSNNSFGLRQSTKVKIPAELAARLRHKFTTQAIDHLSV